MTFSGAKKLKVNKMNKQMLKDLDGRSPSREVADLSARLMMLVDDKKSIVLADYTFPDSGFHHVVTLYADGRIEEVASYGTTYGHYHWAKPILRKHKNRNGNTTIDLLYYGYCRFERSSLPVEMYREEVLKSLFG